MKIRLALALIAIPLLLTGCAPQTGSSEPLTPRDGGLVNVKVGYVELPDGRTVLCVSDKRGASGGLSCDWDSATG